MGGLIGQGFVKFVVSAGLLHCPIAIDVHRANAVLDPRARTTMVSAAFARRLHLAERGTARVTAYGLTADLATMGPVTVDIHPASVRLATVAVETPAMEQQVPAGADVILGADALSAAMLKLDLGTHQMSSISTSDARHATRGLTQVPMQVDEKGRIFVRVAIGNGAPTPALLDLGSEVPVTINRAFAVTHDITPAEGWTAAPAVSFAETGNRLDIAVGHTRLAPDRIRIADGAPEPITLGTAVFGKRAIILDVANKSLWIAG
jgi:hypothetical protein